MGRWPALALGAGGAAALASITQSWPTTRLAGGLALVVVAAHWWGDRPLLARCAAVVPGAVLVAANVGVPLRQRWSGPMLVVVVVVAAAVAPALTARARAGLVPVLALLAAGGVYACVPETDHLQEAALALAALTLAELLARKSLGPAAAVGAVGLLGWATLYGGTYREGALVGGIASLGLLLLEPVARRLPGPRRPLLRGSWPQACATVGLQAGYCLAVSRTAGLQSSFGAALALASPQIVALAITTRLMIGPARSDR